MSSKSRARGLAAASVAVLASLAACTTGPVRPTAPLSSNDMRPDPSRPARPGEPIPAAPVLDTYAESRSAYMPRHIARNESQNLKRIAVLLPFSSTNTEVRKQAMGIYNAIQMALFQVGAREVILMPRDATSADPSVISGIAEDAVKDGAIAIIGPVFAQQVAPVAQRAAEVRAPVLAFSTDVSAFGQGAYLVSLTPYSEVERIVDWATKDGVTRFAMLGPDNANGRTIEQALRQEVAERGGQVVSVEYYTPGNASPQAEARRTASVIEAENRSYPNKVAVLIPETGVQLRSVGALLRAIANVTPREVRFLGTGAWNDPDVWREPGLYGGSFPAPDPTALQDFEKRYQAIYGEAAPRLASFGYDAGALAATLAGADRLDNGVIQRPQGWSGVNGLFRFQSDGSVERALAVMQLQDRGGVKIISPPILEFAAGS
jgi:ABC-type branched-subunit amino acid transport system substrate-binding protein